jgi:hypothetical protein
MSEPWAKHKVRYLLIFAGATGMGMWAVGAGRPVEAFFWGCMVVVGAAEWVVNSRPESGI